MLFEEKKQKTILLHSCAAKKNGGHNHPKQCTVKESVQAEWIGWRHVSGVICVRVGATGGTAQAEQCANQVKEARLKLFRHGGEEGGFIWTKDAEDGAARQKEKMKTPEKIHGCSKEGYAEG